ncbi:MAG TPA: DUF624 domain-containing protein [Bacilli bacterium]|nr:MAG: hypothetical protein BWY97_00209 [Tenericutes bacterium ADurb.BinA124]HNZ50129.1 DUF624 domain-containing protein [Bacilli bacterium]HPN60534.1 DUF624 domain-containing protein [Bacilli bacterium]HPX83685.1 DUF624 domain-containing protein [Bacilli bacterium]HQC74410.1 DUF624 domain-containing protein [Bacilli bacterium]
MKFEKLYNSKFYMFFECLYRLILVNLLFILCSLLGLVVFSVVPAAIALVTVIKSYSSETAFPIGKTFWHIFKKHFKSNLVLSGLFFVLFLIFTFNAYFFFLAWQEYQALINEIIMNLAFVLDGIIIVAFINAIFIRVYFPNLNTKKTLKYAFVLLRALPLRFLAILGILVLMAVITYFFPYYLIFIGFSLLAFIVNALLKANYMKLVADGVTPLLAQDYL